VDAAIGGSNGRWAMDLYAGAGLFTLPLARAFGRVTAVDDSASASRDLEHNASAAGIMNLQTHQATVDGHLLTVTETPDLIVADPPRTGIGKLGLKELVRIRAPRLTIVSCDPATLARDLKGLISAGYKIGEATSIDLFPQTAHFETVAKLRL
jgi:23S rRNA (uracil1939-C5)-methyltransferase